MRPVEQLRRNWDQAARDNARYNVVTIPGQTEEQFYASGQAEVRGVFKRLAELDVKRGGELAMDFGAGLGRLTVALAEHFKQVVGVDVSGEMLDRAKPHKRVRYKRADSLEAFTHGVFDMVYTNITLQHMPGALQQQYVHDFFQVVRPGGVVVFELPHWPDIGYVQHALAMSGAAPSEVHGWIEAAGGQLVATDPTPSAGPSIPSYRYIATRA